jgi:two-component system phosphate regulon sensor histidine kinase PhoR
MYNGGNIITPNSKRAFRFAGLFVPVILIIYGILIQLGIINIKPHINDSGFSILLLFWLCLSIFQFLIYTRTKLDSALRLIAFHLLAGSYIVFVSGVSSPIIGCWLLLMLASYLYFSNLGLQLSALAFVIVVATNIVLWNRTDISAILNDLLVVMAILATDVVTLNISKSQVVKKKELNQSKAQESLQHDRVITIINNMTDAVISTDMNGTIRVYNAVSLNLLDTNNNLNGRYIDDILPLTDLDNNKISLFKEFTGIKTVIKRDDLNYSFSEDEKMRLEVTISPIRSGYSRFKSVETHDGYVIIMHDVTKAKSLEEERDEFISVTSHELRTPIAIAEGTISNIQLMMSHPDVTNKMLEDSIKTAHEQIMFLASIVNDLNTLSRAERGASDEAEDIDVQELAHKLFDKYHQEAEDRKLQLDLDLSPKLGKVHVSRLYLEELLQNFITNAIKYTQKGSVTIIFKKKSGLVTFAIKDTGIGISKSDQSKIYHKFYRSEDYRTRETGGTGLGLYIAAKLTHKIGTKIQLVSRLNFGSTFSITLPEKKN